MNEMVNRKHRARMKSTMSVLSGGASRSAGTGMERLDLDSLVGALDGWRHCDSGLRLDQGQAFEFSLCPQGRFSAEIRTDENKRAGYIELGVDGCEITLRQLDLSQPFQRQGFARALIGHLELILPSLGAHGVALMAMGGGGYAWAALGFDHDLRFNRQLTLGAATKEFIRRREHKVMLIEARGAEQAELATWCRRQAEDELLEGIQQLVTLGKESPWLGTDGRATWFGREVLIASEWFGYRSL